MFIVQKLGPHTILEPQSRVGVYNFGISMFDEAVSSSEGARRYLCSYKNGSAYLSAASLRSVDRASRYNLCK